MQCEPQAIENDLPAQDEILVTRDQRMSKLRTRISLERARGARVEHEGRCFAVLVRRAPTAQLRSLLLFAIGLALFATVGGIIFLGTAIFAAAGWTIDAWRRAEQRVLLHVDEVGRISERLLPA